MTRLYLVFLISALMAIVFGSALDSESKAASTEEYIVQEPSDVETKQEPEQPAVIKNKFINNVVYGKVSDCKEFIEKYDYLTSRFNRDIFEALIYCFNQKEKHEDCWEIFDMLKPSFSDVSKSTTTPLIMSLRKNNMGIFNALIALDGVKSTVDNVDEFARTALMYAAKRGSFFAVRKIIEVSTNSINKKDFMNKTALHYACEMNPVEECKIDSETTSSACDAENKYSIFLTLLHNGAEIDYHGPEFKLSSEDGALKDLITAKGGKVTVTTKPEDLIFQGFVGYTAIELANSFKITDKLMFLAGKLLPLILANPIMLFFNEICYQIQKCFLPGIDLNVVLSLDLGNEFQDISLNLFFLMMLVPLIKTAVEFTNKPNAFKF